MGIHGVPRSLTLRLTSASQIVLNDQNRWFSYITPVGLFQYNQEEKSFIRILEARLLEEMKLGDLMSRAARIDEARDLCINDELSLLQWQQLERDMCEHHGHSLFGFSINEEVFLRFWGHIFQWGEYGAMSMLGRVAKTHEFPPRPDDWEKQLLDWTKKSMVQDVTTSVRTAGQLLLLIDCLVFTSLQYASSKSTQTDYVNFYTKNNDWYLLVTAGVVLLSFASLQNPCSDKKYVLSGLRRARLIMESIIGANQNWTSYAPLILPKSAVTYGIIPAILYGIRKGRFDDNELSDAKYINIANSTRKNTIEIAFSYASINSSLFYLGSMSLINSCFFYYQDLGNPIVYNKLTSILTDIQYSILVIAFLAHIMRYPHADPKIQRLGRYATNTIQGLSNSLLDNFSTFTMIGMAIIAIFKTNSPTPKNILNNSMYFGFQILTLMGVLLITFPNTPDIPILSITPKPIKDSRFTRVYNSTMTGITLMFSHKKQNTEVIGSQVQGFVELTHT